LVALATCIALQMTGFAMVLPLFGRRFEGFGAGVQALAASDMAYSLTGILAAPLTGMLADRFGRRSIILVSLVGNVLAFCGYLLVPFAWLLILLRGLAGVSTAGLVPATMSIVGDLAPEDRRAQWIGIIIGSASAGHVVGPLLGGQLYDRFGFVVPFAASLATAIGALLLAGFLIPETYTAAVQRSRSRLAWSLGRRALPARSTFLMLMLITFGAMFAWAFILPQLMFYGYDDLAWTSALMGLVWSAYGVAFMLGEFALGRLSDRHGRKPVLLLGLVLFLAPFVGLVAFHNLAWNAVSFVLGGLGNALYDPALSASILDMAPPECTAATMGLKGPAGSLGNLLGPALVVLITPLAGPRVVFLIATALVAVVTLAAGLALRLPCMSGVAHQISRAAVER